MKDLFLGLDIGSNSIGWAITDKDYNLKKFNGKDLWGVRSFDEAKNAKERRFYRGGRRRKERKLQRILWLREIFNDEIKKIDEHFFARLDESNLWPDEKTSKNSLFNDIDFNDKAFFKRYPTVYHLKRDLIISQEKKDIRFIYLALSHYMKNRGHFLIESDSNINDVEDINIKNIFDSINLELERLGIQESVNLKNIDKIVKEIAKNKNLAGKRKKQKALQKELGEGKHLNEIYKGLTGGKINFKYFFDKDIYNFEESGLSESFSFEDNKYEEELEEKLKISLNDDFKIIELTKQLYNWFLLYKSCDGERYVSFAKVKNYEKHKDDLKFLKNYIKNNFNEETYKLVFKDFSKNIKKDSKFLKKYLEKNFDKEINNIILKTQKTLNNYAVYLSNADKKKEFYDFIKKLLEHKKDTEGYNFIVSEIDNDNFLPRQRVKDNSVVPHQLYKAEIEKILENASKHYSFLNDKSGELTNIEKLIKIFEFKIPYYVGPLNNQYNVNNGGYAWIDRNSFEKTTPWNFNKAINISKTAENFIKSMISYCSYLKNKKVIAKNSLLYSEYDLLNEINKLKINDEPISVSLKKEAINNLFKQNKVVTYSALKKFLVQEGLFQNIKQINFSGIDGETKAFKANFNSYIVFKNILNDNIENYNTQQAVENIIEWATLFTDVNILKAKIKDNYSDMFNEEQIEKMSKLKFSGWGRLSKEFLIDIRSSKFVDKQTGETNLSIIEILRCTNYNLMQVISDPDLGIAEKLKEIENGELIENITYKDIEELYCSSSVKKQIWQAVLIAKELKKVLGNDPEKIFIEMARGGEDKKRTLSRKKRLQEIYDEAIRIHKEYKQELEKIKPKLKSIDDDKFKIKKLYHYFMQMGRCMYTNKEIDLNELLSDSANNKYDIDHIYPQSKIKDDSITNTVLVDRTSNAVKTDIYPLNKKVQEKCSPLWLSLKKCGLISQEKYDRLIRKTELTAEEKLNFVAKQLVETRQSTKALAKLLESIFPESKIVYSKAENISMFRNYFGPSAENAQEKRLWDYGFVKCRETNDLHHAKDAYLNIVVGNIYDTKFSKFFYVNKNKSKEYKEYNKYGSKEERLEHFSRLKYHMKKMYDFNTEGAWRVEDNESLKIVINNINRNTPLFTKESKVKKGQFWNENASKKEKDLIPIKKELSNTLKYGGYKGANAAYFIVVEYENKKGQVEKKFETIPIYLANKSEKNREVIIEYLVKKLKLKNPKVIVEKIKIGSLLQLDNSLVFITGNSGDSLLLNIGSQLILPSIMSAYIKTLQKYKEKLDYSTKFKKALIISEKDGLVKDKNIELYNIFINKLSSRSYRIIPNSLINFLIEKKDKFSNLNIGDQAVCLLQILPAFKKDATSADLSKLNGVKSAGKLTVGKVSVFNNYSNIKIIDYSITGLFKTTRKIA
jgi:CRISPR-associated endonuclease Csn1